MSTRMEYRVDALRAKIEERYEARVTEAQNIYEHDSDLAARRDVWRADVEAAVTRLQIALPFVSDTELESFEVPKMPRLKRATYSNSPEETRDQEIEKATNQRKKCLNRLDTARVTFVGDVATLSLTPHMLEEWLRL